jgi:hypothetical protein
MMKYRARYNRIGASPFEPDDLTHQTDYAHIDADFPKTMSLLTIKKLAKDATPKGWEFIEVRRMKKEI